MNLPETCTSCDLLAEPGLKERATHLDELAAELEFFSRAVTHDLRAPLRVIGGYSHLIKSSQADTLDPEALAHLERIIASVTQLDQLVTGLFSLSQTAHFQLQRTDVDLTHIASELLKEHEAQEAHRIVGWSVAPNLRSTADPVLVRILLSNLIGNAWKYSSKSSAPTIVVGSMEADGEQAFFVRDNGVGFDMKHVGALFQPFQRLHNQHDFPGSGVGLTIVRRVARAHKGRVWAESGSGSGATFCFTLQERPRTARPQNEHDTSTVRSPTLPSSIGQVSCA